MGTNVNPEFHPRTDRELREGIRRYYYDVVFKNSFKFPIYIKLPEHEWLSTNSLNLILIFIETILSERPNTKIYIDLFDKHLFEKLPVSDAREDITDGSVQDTKLIESVRRKILFYDSTKFSTTLYEYGVNVFPTPQKYIKLQQHLEAFPGERRWKYSSRMLALSKLIENELEQRALSDRIATMATILYKNLFGRITPEEARKDSEQIMYELVKNIYQHSEKTADKIAKNSGFACAQIIPIPLLNTPPIDTKQMKELLFIEWKTVKKTWQFLSITISDFGVGLANKIRSDLIDRKVARPFKYGRFTIDDNFLKSDYLLMLLASTTHFTTKKYEHGDERFLEHKLEEKGFGFIFCLAFVAKNYGRMEIRSGSSKVIFIAKPEAYFADLWNNVGVAANMLESYFDKYFTTQEITLSEEEAVFPGTQILIEIPVEVFA